MNTQQAVSTQGTVHEELKSERVQEPVALFRTQLKSERIQEGLAAAGEVEAPIASIELAVYQPQAVTIEVYESRALAITLHGNPAGSGSGGGNGTGSTGDAADAG